MMNAAIKSGKRFQKQLNELEEKKLEKYTKVNKWIFPNLQRLNSKKPCCF